MDEVAGIAEVGPEELEVFTCKCEREGLVINNLTEICKVLK